MVSDYRPQVEGFEGRHLDEAAGRDGQAPRLLGIRLDSFDLDSQPKPGEVSLFGGPIRLSLFNVGGNGGDASPIGACMVFYDIEPSGNQWIVKHRGSFDP